MNKEKVKEIFNMLYALGVVVILFYIVYSFLKNLGLLIINGVEKISNITSNMDSVVIVALITGTVSIITVIISSIISRWIEYKQITKRYLYEKREIPYKKFIEMVYKIQASNKNGKPEYTQVEILDDLSDFSEELTLWGSSKVIKKWIKFRENAMQKNTGTQNLFVLEEIVFEIRKDMGQKKKRIKTRRFVGIFYK